MFLGHYQHSIDEKGRLTIPARFRELLGEGAYVTQGLDRNLMVMTSAHFQRVYDNLTGTSLTDPTARDLNRVLLANAYPVEIDKIGRILLPQNLRAFLGLEKEAAVVGVGKYFEIWTPADWAKKMELLQDPDANTQRFAALDI